MSHPGFFADDEAHPTTREIVMLLRDLVAVDPYATVKILSGTTTFAPEVARIRGIQIHGGVNPQREGAPEVPIIGTLGLINAMLRRLNADEVGFEFDEHGNITYVGAKLNRIPREKLATICTDESVVGYDPNKHEEVKP